jgi:hypothetical protein
LYRPIAPSVFANSSCNTSFSAVTPSNFSDSAFAVLSNCSLRPTNSYNSNLFFINVCCSISFSRFSFFLFYRNSYNWFSSLLHFALASLSAFWVIYSWFFRLRYMFSAASRWLRIVPYYF